VVIYMGLSALPLICEKLIEHGLPPSHPIAVVQQGTTPDHRVVSGVLANISERVAAAALRSPSLIIIGEVIRLHDKLAWFAPQPNALITNQETCQYKSKTNHKNEISDSLNLSNRLPAPMS
jgi:3-deoxy-D-arabino-heptulosonate 7-phosphate (DAHP) synthase class II